VRFSRGNTSDSSTPEAPTSSKNGFLGKSIFTILAVLNRENLEALCKFVSGRAFDPSHLSYRNDAPHNETAHGCSWVGFSTRKEGGALPQIEAGTVYSGMYGDRFLAEKIRDTMERISGDDPDALSAIRTTMLAATSSAGREAQLAALSQEERDGLLIIQAYHAANGMDLSAFARA
jgi:hypothetical protein